MLRERGNQYLEHERSNKPPVLAFDYEMVLDGRKLPKPTNYALLRIKPAAGHPATDANKRPFVVDRSARRARARASAASRSTARSASRSSRVTPATS